MPRRRETWACYGSKHPPPAVPPFRSEHRASFGLCRAKTTPAHHRQSTQGRQGRASQNTHAPGSTPTTIASQPSIIPSRAAFSLHTEHEFASSSFPSPICILYSTLLSIASLWFLFTVAATAQWIADSDLIAPPRSPALPRTPAAKLVTLLAPPAASTMADQSTIWEKTKTGGKAGWQKVYALVDKLGPPVNRLSNKLGSEAFWPTSMDKECDKAARILRSFCKDGFYTEEEQPTAAGPKQKQRVLKKIPSQVIANAKALAIFTTMRSGLWISGSGGSGVLVARKADGSWSPPSGIQVQTMALGFLVGVDIYDCVLVINTQPALEAFTRFRATLGGDLSVTAGPVGAGFLVESELHKRQAPIFTYLKSRGFYAGLQIDGTVIIERVDENERFYGERIPAQDILKGKVRHPPFESRGLLETLKAAEGDESYDASMIPTDEPPSNYEVQHDGQTFGVPDKDDPDPYGVLQLEKEGMVIREAGTQKRASWEQFTFSPAITSPVYDTFDRKSSNRDSKSSAMSWRSSGLASPSMNGTMFSPLTTSDARSSRDSPRTPMSMSDAGTQTDDLPPPPRSPGRSSMRLGALGTKESSMEHIPEHEAVPLSPSMRSHSGSSVGAKLGSRSSPSRASTPPTGDSDSRKELPDEEPLSPVKQKAEELEHSGHEVHHADEEEEEEEHIIVEEPVVHSVQRSVAPTVLQRARMVDVPKRGPPPMLPPRNPNRGSGPMIINGERPDSRASQLSNVALSMDETPADSSEQIHLSTELEARAAEDTPSADIETHTDSWVGDAPRRDSIEDKNGRASTDMPGAFHSFPTTPNEEIGHAM
ncbi:hypothetical protein ANO11243_087730 [Dothideomycetidae sp. 11243]|nr:hypothetical protein ANO11243_087730 [fungal sp. No.11243]